MTSPTTALIRDGLITLFPNPDNTEYGIYQNREVEVASVKKKAQDKGYEVYVTHIIKADEQKVGRILITTFPSGR